MTAPTGASRGWCGKNQWAITGYGATGQIQDADLIRINILINHHLPALGANGGIAVPDDPQQSPPVSQIAIIDHQAAGLGVTAINLGDFAKCSHPVWLLRFSVGAPSPVTLRRRGPLERPKRHSHAGASLPLS